MNLTRKQIRYLLEGELEIMDFREKNSKNNSTGKSPSATTSKGDSIYELMSIPGMKLSEKAKQRLLKIRDKKLKEKKND